jgi:hypothetical protein
MCAINGTNTFLEMGRIVDKCKHSNWLNLRQINMINKYLHIWVPSLATHDFWMCGSGRRLDHFIPKLTNSIENLVEDSTNYLNESPKRLVNYLEPLVVTNNMEEPATCSSTEHPLVSLTRPLPLKRLHRAKKELWSYAT